MPSINLNPEPQQPVWNPDTQQFEGAPSPQQQQAQQQNQQALQAQQPANSYQTGGSLYGLSQGVSNAQQTQQQANAAGAAQYQQMLAQQQAQAQADQTAATQALANQQGANQYGQMMGQQAIAQQQNIAQSSHVSRPGIAGADENAARAAAFARAKDQAALTARASLNALADELTGRGMLGSGEDFIRTSGVVNRAAQGVNEFTREQLIQDLNRNAQIADQTYQGNIAQRGQDLGLSPSILGLVGNLY